MALNSQQLNILLLVAMSPLPHPSWLKFDNDWLNATWQWISREKKNRFVHLICQLHILHFWNERETGAETCPLSYWSIFPVPGNSPRRLGKRLPGPVSFTFLSSWILNASFSHPCPQSLLGVWAWGPGGSGDTGFEVLDFRNSGHFRFKRKLKDSLLTALKHLNLQSLTLLQEEVNANRNVVENQKWPEVLKSRTSNHVSPEPPGPLSQAPRKLWGREPTQRC